MLLITRANSTFNLSKYKKALADFLISYMVYFIVLFIEFLLIYQFDYLQKNKNKWIWYYFIMVVLICIAGFRYNLGIDTFRYQKYYETSITPIYDLTLSDLEYSRYQPLYVILCSLCKTVVSDFWFFQLIHAALVNSVIFYFFKKYTKYVFVAVCLYSLSIYLGYNMETMRASCAVVMMLLGYDQFKEGRKILSLLFFIASYLFHVEAIILFPLYLYLLLADKKITLGKNVLIIAIILTIITPLLASILRNNLLLFALTASIGDKIDIYASTGFNSSLNWKGIIVTVVATLALPAIFIYSFGKQKKHFSHNAMLLITLLVFLLCVPLFIFYRYKEFMTPFMILLMSEAFGLNKIHIPGGLILGFKSFLLKILIILLPYFWVGVIGKLKPLPDVNIPAYWEYYPYSSIFNETDYSERHRLYDYYIDGYE